CGTQTSPGLIINDGVLTDLNASIIVDAKSTSNNKLNGLHFYTVGPNGLQFIYSRDKDQFEMAGGLALSIPTGKTSQTIAVTMLDPKGGPGLILTNGQLTQLDMQLTAS